jgi:GntR family transcriptional regulator / MocR family aminotransferase
MANRSDLSRFALQSGAGALIYRQIYQRIRGGILSGELRAGSRLPSARGLASQLAVARGTVETAYQILAAEGYIVGRGATGTFVDHVIPSPPAAARRLHRQKTDTEDGRRSAGPADASLLFRLGLPALDAFPRKLWSRLTAQRARAFAPGDLAYQDPAGQIALRRTIAFYLRVARGVACAPEQIFITTGYQGALALIGQTLLQAGDAVWVEDPGYHFGRQALELTGARLVAIPVDGSGLDVARGCATAAQARLAVVTPCHQFPLGATLPISRRLALLDWAAAADAWIVEDDYDSEFRYRGRPLPALKSIDARQRVLYAGTFSKVLFPALRVGYLVVPEALTASFRAACAAVQPAPSALAQSVVAAFIEDGHFARHIRRMRQLYAERRAALTAALQTICGDAMAIEAPAGGMHLIARLPPGADDLAVVARARRRDLWPVPLSPCAVKRPIGPGLLLGFTNVPTEVATKAARALRGVLAP